MTYIAPDGVGEEPPAPSPNTPNPIHAIVAYVAVASIVIGLIAAMVWPEPKPTYVPEPTQVKFCQPFQTKTVLEANAYYLARDGYQVVLAQDLPEAFKARSEGKADLIIQTEERCFTHLGDSGHAVNRYYMKKLRKS